MLEEQDYWPSDQDGTMVVTMIHLKQMFCLDFCLDFHQTTPNGIYAKTGFQALARKSISTTDTLTLEYGCIFYHHIRK